MFKEIKNKFIEAIVSIVPIVIIVITIYSLQFSKVFPSDVITNNELIIFLISILFLIIGMGVFSFSVDLSMIKVGHHLGTSITKKRSLTLMLIITFILGFIITIAEPDVTVLADLLQVSINPWLFKIVISLGVGLFLSLGVIKILFNKNLKFWLLFFYFIIFALAAILDDQTGDSIIAIAFDSGGVTTGPITVPFLITFGAGFASATKTKNNEDSFGITGLCSIGPVISTMLFLLILNNFVDLSLIKNSIDIDAPILGTILHSFFEILIAILPISIFFVIYQSIFIKLPKHELKKILWGFFFTFIGLGIFLASAKIGLIPIGYKLGNVLSSKDYGSTYYFLLIIIAILIGFASVLIEPGVHVLTGQVEEISNGLIKKKQMFISLGIGVTLAIVLEVVRQLYGPFPIIYYLVPIYICIFILTFFAPDIFIAIGFDSGGVATGTMASCFVLPFIIGIAATFEKSSGFGVIGLIAAMPPLVIQLNGLNSVLIKTHRYKKAKKSLLLEDDAQIINF